MKPPPPRRSAGIWLVLGVIAMACVSERIYYSAVLEPRARLAAQTIVCRYSCSSSTFRGITATVTDVYSDGSFVLAVKYSVSDERTLDVLHGQLPSGLVERLADEVAQGGPFEIEDGVPTCKSGSTWDVLWRTDVGPATRELVDFLDIHLSRRGGIHYIVRSETSLSENAQAE